MDQHTIATEGISATIRTLGAELCSLRADDTEFLWQAGPAWPRHAPNLFPIVGRLKDDTLRHDGIAYRMTQHGFARDLPFTWVEATGTRARLALMDDATTRAKYPFAFRLEISFEVAGGSLTQTFSVTNTGDVTLPASFGAHPAFAWPLRPGLAKESHTLTFSDPEPAPIRRLAGGLIIPETIASPIEGDTLRLHESLFANDALILDQLASRSVRYAAPGAPSITVAWAGMAQLGIWTKPADFLCIEPWQGLSSPRDFDGDFADKPALLLIPPGETRDGSLIITI